MPDIKELLTTMIEPLIDYPQDLEIDQIETDEFMEYHISVNPEDVGRVIGRRGRVIRSIRTIIYSIRPESGKRSRIIVDDSDDNDDNDDYDYED